MRGIERLLVERHFHHFLYLCVRDGSRPAGTRSIFFQGGNSTFEKAIPPACRLFLCDAHLKCDLLVFQTCASPQHNPRSFHHAGEQRTSPCHALQDRFLFRVKFNRRCQPHTVSSSTVIDAPQI